MVLNLLIVSIWSLTFHFCVNLIIVVKWSIENADVTNGFIQIITNVDVNLGKKKY